MYRFPLFVVCALVAFNPATGSAQVAQQAGRTSSAVHASLPRVLPGTSTSVFATIQGNALTGIFSFGAVDPGTYVVELLGTDRKVLSASELLTISSGDVGSAIVKLPHRLPPLGGVSGHTVQQAMAVRSAAAASGVLATNVAGVDASAR